MSLKAKIKDIPYVGPLLRLLSTRLKDLRFSSSTDYWEKRYQSGGNSGGGSYDHLAKFKAETLNDFVKSHDVKSVIELGSGDGNQLIYANYPSYIGFDISETAIKMAQNTFKDDQTKMFLTYDQLNEQRADLSLSLDVIYHLVEDHIFEEYLRNLFKTSDRFVIIYSSNQDEQVEKIQSKHVRHRTFTTWIDKNIEGWQLIKKIPNKYPYDGDYEKSSFADFYIYQKSLSL